MRTLPATASLLLTLAACGAGDDPSASSQAQASQPPGSQSPTGGGYAEGQQSQPREEATAGGAPVETGPPNVPELKPAFAGQTRAAAVKTTTQLAVTEIAAGLDKPWAIDFLPGGRMIVSEKAAGTLRVVGSDGRLSSPIAGLPRSDNRGQGGVLDVAVAPDFARSGLVYWSYAEPRDGGNGTAVARGRLIADGPQPRMDDVRVIFRMQPTLDSTMHYGSRIVFAPDGKLFVTLGERSILPGRVQAQDLNSHLGKIVRINADGTVPQDNPFVGRSGARPEIWSYGHRNIQAATLDPQGRLWEVEMGPQGGDELNRPERGRNYGWPVIGYGEEYSGDPIHKSTQAAGMEQPVYYWDPVISPSGMIFYSGGMFPEWKGNILVGGLSSKALVRLVLDGDRVVGEERLLTDRNARIRDVAQGPDGAIYVITDDSNGRLLRIAAAR
jgi:glucose/arabinose dehydrogenase